MSQESQWSHLELVCLHLQHTETKKTSVKDLLLITCTMHHEGRSVAQNVVYTFCRSTQVLRISTHAHTYTDVHVLLISVQPLRPSHATA